MGMFSSLIYKGTEYQFKTGYDLCDTFNVGDEVPFRPIKERPGYCEFDDGVYRAFTKNGTAWVIIKEHKLLEPVDYVEDENENNYEEVVNKFFNKKELL